MVRSLRAFKGRSTSGSDMANTPVIMEMSNATIYLENTSIVRLRTLEKPNFTRNLHMVCSAARDCQNNSYMYRVAVNYLILYAYKTL